MKNIVLDLWYFLCKYFFVGLSNEKFTYMLSFINYKRIGIKWYKYNLDTPKSFNEKLNHLKYNHRFENGEILADKILVRDFVKNRIGESFLVPLIGVYYKIEEIDFNKLPNSFALKTNHGSGWNIICTNKSSLKWSKSKKLIKNWLQKNAYYLSREWQYREIKPGIIIEELLGFNIKDYKFFCFDGEPKFIQVDSDRFTKHQRTLYDLNWEPTNYQIRYDLIDKEVPKPIKFNEMLEVSKKLSRGLKFCRVDLFEHEGRIFFGEITLHPGGGMEPFINKDQDIDFGKFLNI